MAKKSEPEIELEIVVDDSPEARAAYLDTLKLIIRDIREKRERAKKNNLTRSA